MTFAPRILTDFLDHGFDDLIDVRSPAEYAEDHLPGAINLPVLSNEERAEVGTIYKQDSPFRARKIGAAIVIRNIAGHLEGPLAGREGGWRPLFYCWRGGQRSGTFAMLAREIGWRAEAVPGGYQTFRRMVVTMLYDTDFPARAVLLDGYTGTAKTEVLARLHARGVQVIDLEGLARHRGSALGGQGDQPSQKGFETALAQVVARLDPAQPVVIEAESSRIGRVNLPPRLFAAMKDAPRIEIAAGVEARAAYLARAYREVLADHAGFARRVDKLRRLQGHARVDRWVGLAAEGDFQRLTRELAVEHYDPRYARSRERIGAAQLARIDGGDLSELSLEGVADEVVRALGRLPRV